MNPTILESYGSGKHNKMKVGAPLLGQPPFSEKIVHSPPFGKFSAKNHYFHAVAVDPNFQYFICKIWTVWLKITHNLSYLVYWKNIIQKNEQKKPRTVENFVKSQHLLKKSPRKVAAPPFGPAPPFSKKFSQPIFQK